MTALRLTGFRIPEELHDALMTIKERDGIPVSEQVRRALETWVSSKGVTVKTERKRVAARKRP